MAQPKVDIIIGGIDQTGPVLGAIEAAVEGAAHVAEQAWGTAEQAIDSAAMAMGGFRQEASRMEQVLSGVFSNTDIERLTSDLRAGGDAADKAVAEIVRGLNQVEDETDRTRRGVALFGDAWNEVEREATQAMDKVKNEAGEVQKSLKFDAAQLGLAGLGAGVSHEFEAAAGSAGHLQAVLGLTGEQAKELGAVAMDVYQNNFGESLREANSGVALINQSLKLQGDALKAAAQDGFRLKDVYDVDLRESVNTVRAMTNVFGIDASQAFDLITYGMQNGVNVSDDLLDSLTEYSPSFQRLGLNADQMLLSLKSGLEAGILNTDKLADSVNEFGILMMESGGNASLALTNIFSEDKAAELQANFAKGGEAARQATYTIIEGLMAVKDPIERNTAGVQLFGSMWEDTAGKVAPAILAARDATLETQGATDSLDAEYSGLMVTLEGFKRGFEVNILEPFGTAGPVVQEAISGLSGVGSIMLGLSGLGINLGGALTTVGGKFVGLLGPIASVQGLMGLFLGPVGIIMLIVALLAGLYLAWENNWGGIQEKTAAAVDTIKGVLGTIGDLFDDAVEWGANILSGLWDGIKRGASAFLMGGIPGLINEFILKPFFGIDLFETGKQIIKRLIDGIKSIHIPMPHINISWGSGPMGISIPKFNVEWYAQGGIFTGPSVIGVGEAGDEAVLPIDRIVPLFTQAIQAAGGAGGGLYIDMRGSTFLDGTDAGNRTVEAMERKGWRLGG